MSDEIGKFILPKMMREIREALGLTQEELCNLTNLSRQTISYLETGASTPSLATASKWLDAITLEIKKLRKRGEELKSGG